MLSGISQEAQGAVQGVQGSANGALPGYARAAEGFEKTLRNAAAKGSPVLHQRAESAPDNILQTTRRIGGEVDLRLHANRDQLTRSLDAREAEHAQQASQIRDGFDAFLAETSTQAAGRFNETTTNFESAFDGLAGTVSQAAASWTRLLSVRLAGVIAAKRVEAAAALSTLLTGQPAAAPVRDGGGGAAGGGADAGGGVNSEAACDACVSATGGGGGGGASEPAASGRGNGRRSPAEGPDRATAGRDRLREQARRTDHIVCQPAKRNRRAGADATRATGGGSLPRLTMGPRECGMS